MNIQFDPSTEPPVMLRAFAVFLQTIANECDHLQKIAHADNPATGTVSPQEAFGLGNVAAASPSASFPANALANAASPAAGGPQSNEDVAPPLLDPMAAFAGGSLAVPNVPGGALYTADVMPSRIAPVGQLSTSILPAPGFPMPVPLPASAAPIAAGQVQPGTPAPGGEIDADGLPWDSRIHSSSGKRNKGDDKWTAKRGVMPQTVAAVTAELRAAMSVGKPQPPQNTAPPGMQQSLPPPPMLTPTPPPLAQNTPGAGASSRVLTTADLLPRVTSAMAAGTLTAEMAGALAVEVSSGAVQNVAMFAVAPQLIPAYWARLDQLGVA